MIVAIFAVEKVIATGDTNLRGIVQIVSKHNIIAAPAEQRIGPIAAIQLIIFAAAIQDVISYIAIQFVEPRIA
jgi:hypothetical protein